MRGGKREGAGRPKGEGNDGLRPWEEVQTMWNSRSGERITSARVRQIAKRAMRKLRQELTRVAA